MSTRRSVLNDELAAELMSLYATTELREAITDALAFVEALDEHFGPGWRDVVRTDEEVNHASWQEAGTVDQATGAVRSVEARGLLEDVGGQDQQRPGEEGSEALSTAYDCGWHDGCDYGYRLARRELGLAEAE